MALQLKIAFLQKGGCRELHLFEKTGAFDNPDNLTGYGAPNPEIADVALATLEVTMPDASIVSLDITNDFAAVFPTVDDTEALTVSNEDLGLSVDEQLPHGIYTFKYTLFDVDDETIAQGTFYFIVDCALYCCLDNLLATLEDCSCCDDLASRTKNFRIRMAYIYLAAAQAAAGCGKHLRAQKLLDFVSDICLDSHCNCH